MNTQPQAPLDVLAVCNYIVGLDHKQHRFSPKLSNMALQKLLYFAEGQSLAESGRSLFDARIEAWDYGPVVPDAYHAFKDYGADVIDEPASTLVRDENYSWRWVTPEIPRTRSTQQQRDLLERIWQKLGRLSGVELMRASHQAHSPWTEIYGTQPRSAEIPRPLMKSYFEAHPIVPRS